MVKAVLMCCLPLVRIELAKVFGIVNSRGLSPQKIGIDGVGRVLHHWLPHQDI